MRRMGVSVDIADEKHVLRANVSHADARPASSSSSRRAATVARRNEKVRSSSLSLRLSPHHSKDVHAYANVIADATNK